MNKWGRGLKSKYMKTGLFRGKKVYNKVNNLLKKKLIKLNNKLWEIN
jgi:hypothetical protein